MEKPVVVWAWFLSGRGGGGLRHKRCLSKSSVLSCVSASGMEKTDVDADQRKEEKTVQQVKFSFLVVPFVPFLVCRAEKFGLSFCPERMVEVGGVRHQRSLSKSTPVLPLLLEWMFFLGGHTPKNAIKK